MEKKFSLIYSSSKKKKGIVEDLEQILKFFSSSGISPKKPKNGLIIAQQTGEKKES